MITIIIHKLLFLFILYSYGIIFLKKIFKSKSIFNFYEISLIGLVIILLFYQVVNYFISLSDNLLFFNIIILIIFFLFNKKLFLNNFHLDYRIFILVTILSIVNIYGSGFSDDIDHYHYSSITNSDERNLIWGYSYLHPLFGTMSLWLTGHSFLNFDNTRFQDIHLLNGIILLLVLGLFLNEIFENKQKNNNLNPLLFSILIFILFKYTRLKEFGIDRPAVLIFCFLIYFYLKHFLIEKKNLIQNFVIISLISVVIISIKIIYLPVIFLPFILILNHKKDLFEFNYKYLVILFSGFVFISKSILTSGCLVYPVSFTCLDFLDWSDSLRIYEYSKTSEIINKSWSSYVGNLKQEIYIQDFNWFKTWFNRGKIELSEFLLLSLTCAFLTLFVYNYSLKNLIDNFKNLKVLICYLLLIIIFSLIIFFIKNPVIRMNHHFLISLNLLIVCLFCNFQSNVIKKKILIFFFIVGFIFNFSKNLNRIYQGKFINDPLSQVSSKIHDTNTHKLNNFIYFQGWYGKAPIGNQILNNRKHQKKLIFDIIY